MKRILYVIVFGTILIALSGCEEIPPPIDFSEGRDTTFVQSNIPSPQIKNVLIEDFTGVKCNACPNAHDAIKAIQLANPGRVVAISLHIFGTVLAFPYTGIPGYQDFRTNTGTDLYSTLNTGSLPGIPAGATDRTLFVGQSGLLNNNPSSWSSFVGQQLVKSTPINIELDNQYDASTRELIMTAKAILTKGLPSDTIFFSVAITESEIVNPQKMPSLETDTFYIHNHVLRQMLTPDNGSQLQGNYEPGRVFQKGFTVQLPPLWNADKCKVIAFVHKSGNIKEVWQVVEKAVK